MQDNNQQSGAVGCLAQGHLDAELGSWSPDRYKRIGLRSFLEVKGDVALQMFAGKRVPSREWGAATLKIPTKSLQVSK